MRVLAIETSCDETGVAILEGVRNGDAMTFEVLGSALLSQADLHAPYGGVYPTLAKREHEKNLPIMLEQALTAAKTSCGKKGPRVSTLADNHPVGKAGPDHFFSQEVFTELQTLDIDALAVTYGPGLEPALWTGVTFAKALARATGLPLMGVNHMEGHLVSSLARQSLGEGGVQYHTIEHIPFPVLGLLISGGHTEFVLMKDWFDYEIVGKTLDDAVGEAFDKVARLLDLPYPGGPHISRIADTARKKNNSETQLPEKGPRVSTLADNRPVGKAGPDHFSSNCVSPLPRPMLQSKNCDMSFSGLKTAALYALRGKTLSDNEKAAFAREFEDAVGDVFVAKTRRALIETGAKTFVIGGGVAANRYIRERLQALILEEFETDVEFRLPDIAITGDNAVMIAQAALVHLLKEGVPQGFGEDIRAEGNLSLNSIK